jgi:hypothetical protein
MTRRSSCWILRKKRMEMTGSLGVKMGRGVMGVAGDAGSEG